MKNPGKTIETQFDKAKQMIPLAFRIAVYTERLKKWNKVDLRKYRGNPEKKQRIRALRLRLALWIRLSHQQILTIQSRSVPRFERGAIVIPPPSGGDNPGLSCKLLRLLDPL